MALNLKKILSLSGGIAATVMTGGATAPVLIPQALGLAAEFFPGEDPTEAKRKAEALAKKAELDGWERVMIVQWVELWKRLLSRPMSAETRSRTFEGRVASDFILNYADDPKDEWVTSIREMVEKAVRWQIATSSQGDTA